ncbi:MAG: glycosyl hydrolase [Chloroflexota bacterium]
MNQFNLEKLLKWRCIGPFRGGRVLAVAGDPSNDATFYFGAAAGGVWKTSDGGTYWECVSDGYFKTSSVGALAVAESDPNVIYAGMGETTIRVDVSHGDGIYKSTDAGRSWQHMGLSETRHIGKIAVHPQNPDIAYVAALGHAHGNNPERGIYRTIDGGKNWELVLHKSDKAGAVDVKLDPNNPRIIYATIWEAYRNFWQISSGGPDSGLWRSMDGGDTWEDISRNKGLPEGLLGKLGVAPSPAKPGRVFALFESKNKPGVYVSDDYGDTWEHTSSNGELYGRAWYYIHINADTQDANTVYVNCFNLWKSIDGGKNFTQIATPHGDNHDIWIDPNNNQRMVQGNDGGANVSYNGGASWSTIYNQPTAQFYHIATDNQYPYHVYGTQQDNSSLAIPNASERGAIPWAAIYQAGTGESGYIAPRPDDHNIVYVGAIGSSPGGGNSLQKYNHRTKQIQLIANWPETNRGYGAEVYKYRFNWTYPIVISPHDPNVLYVGSNIVLKSLDGGHSWEEISPDLTRNDVEKLQPTGGPINLDAIGAETYCTVFTFAESFHEPGVLWAGSDDGLIHISKDGGQNWADVTPAELPEWTMISMIALSPHDPATAYVAATKYKLDDYNPYLFKTNDYGQSWTAINNGIRDEDYTRVIREDPAKQGLLYAGTETGLYVSFDDGAHWQSLNLNLPVCPIHDIVIKDNDLIAGTHGRSIWVLDDITPLHQLHEEMADKAVHLFKPRDSWRVKRPLFDGFGGGAPGKNYNIDFTEIITYYEEKTPENQIEHKMLDAGQNPPKGAIIGYYLKEASDSLTLEFLNEGGELIRTFTNKPAERDDMSDDEKEALKSKLYAPANQGMNRFIWDMRYEEGTKLKGKEMSAAVARGPIVPPGAYQVRLTVGEQSAKQSFTIKLDPRVKTSVEALETQAALLLKIRDRLGEANEVLNSIHDMRTQVKGVIKRAKDEKVQSSGKSLVEKLDAVEDSLMVRGLKSRGQMMNTGARLLGKLVSFHSYVASADVAPTAVSDEYFITISDEIAKQLAAYDGLLAAEVAEFNTAVSKAGIAGVIVD